jgi:hypothetical protein
LTILTTIPTSTVRVVSTVGTRPSGYLNDEMEMKWTLLYDPMPWTLRPDKTERQMPKGGHHKWHEDDDLVALYMSRHETNDLPRTQDEIAKLLGMSEASLIMRQRNFTDLEGGHGLSHVAKQSIRVHERHKNTPKAELRSLVLRVIKAKSIK